MHKNKKSLGIIPARFASVRFPGKPLADIGGKTMIQRVYEQAAKAKKLDSLLVATDDTRIFEEVLRFGGKVEMTAKTHQSGTDRCAEIIARTEWSNFEKVINIQGDEPFIIPAQIDQLIDFLEKNATFAIATLVKKISCSEDLFNPNTAKVVFDHQNSALYFSRNPIPFLRKHEKKEWLGKGAFYQHLGMYAYRKKTLLEIALLKQSRLELAESLEQLRWLENGFSIGVKITEFESIAIDTPQDLERL